MFIDGKSSTLRDILVGVPQGSILGPLLFLIYINDLPEHSELLSLLFADDTTLLTQADSPEELFDQANREFYKITNYFRKNRLSIHPNKTNFIVFTNNKNVDLTKFNINLNENNPNQQSPLRIHTLTRICTSSEIPAAKFLGLYIDPQLNYKYHVSTIRKKISSALYFMRTAKNLLDKRSLTSLYYSLIHSHLIYAIQVWSSCNNDSMNTLFKLQKRAIRIIHSLPYNGHTESYFKQSKILPLPKLIHFFGLQFMQQFSQGFLPVLLRSVWTTNENRNDSIRPYRLRNHEELFLPVSRLIFLEKHPLYYFPKIWAEFSSFEIKIQREKYVFNTMLKTHILTTLMDNYICSCLLCPTCHLGRQNLSSE